jgi:putative SOS response-associated peptidase YedK
MCGRFTLRAPNRIKVDGLRTAHLPSLEPRYNIAPSQQVLAITGSRQQRELSLFVWGLIPSWSKEPKGFINARAETLELRASFSDSFHRKRCLIPADGFYEWKRTGKSKRPYYFQLQDEGLFAFAGIWDEWRKDDVSITSCAIITTRPNDLVATIHDRMPVILPAESHDLWLDPEAQPDELTEILSPYPAAEMKSYPVSSEVNRPQNDNERLVIPVDPASGETPSLFE